MDTQFDIFVIGGGSGGLTVVDEAQKLGLKVGLADYIKPSPKGTVWGTGGTCPNVGCIPKKLMHMAALVGEIRHEVVATGWEGVDPHGKHNWTKLVNEVQRQVKGINNGNDGWLAETNGITYYNQLGKIKSANVVELTDKDGKKTEVSTKYIVIAVGSRPTYPSDIKNVRELAITSDDLFSLQHAPGKTLVVGASYVALECAGFLHGLGYDVTVMVRSIFLRGFDQEMADRVADHMKLIGVKFIRGTVPTGLEQGQDGRKIVKWNINNVEHSDVYDTVLFAIGRSADTNNLGLEQVGVVVNKENGKVIADESDQTSVNNIFAIGDCVQGRLELTPTAIMCGKRLVQRLFKNGNRVMEYSDVSTTVFTPLEYGCVGLSEDEAIKKFGKEQIRVYHSEFTPLFWNFCQRKGTCYGKLIVELATDIVVGFHFLGPDAAEVTQGFGVFVKMRGKKSDIDNTVGIHPSLVEEMVQLSTWK